MSIQPVELVLACVGIIATECQWRSARPADVMLFAVLLTAVADRRQPLVISAITGITKPPLTPDRNIGEIVVMTAFRRLIESGHDGAPVRAMARTRTAVDMDGDGVANFVGYGLAIAAGVSLRDGEIETDDLRSQPPALPAELNLAGTAAGQIEANRRPFHAL